MRLILLRHAKSSWDHPGLSDHARPLNSRGRRDAPAMAARLKERGWVPELVISSDALRTRETWGLMAPVLGEDIPVRWSSGLYHAGEEGAHEELLAHAEGYDCVALVGHNPGWEELIEALSGTSCRLTTCNAALLHQEAPGWDEALRGRWELVELLRPRSPRD